MSRENTNGTNGTSPTTSWGVPLKSLQDFEQRERAMKGCINFLWNEVSEREQWLSEEAFSEYCKSIKRLCLQNNLKITDPVLLAVNLAVQI